MDWDTDWLSEVLRDLICNFVGEVIGHAISSFSETAAHGITAAPPSDDPPTPAETAALSTAAFLARLVQETGGFDPQRSEAITQVCVEIAESERLPPHEVRQALPVLAGNDALIDEVIRRARGSRDLRFFLLCCAWSVAISDNDIDQAERTWIESAALRMGDTEGLAQLLGGLLVRGGQDRTHEAAYQVLGLSPGASPEQVRARYRELSNKFHPYRYRAAPPALREHAATRLAEIKWAYEVLSHAGLTPLYGLSAGQDRLTAPSPRLVVRCFLCGQKCRLPSGVFDLRVARCPNCQVLLLLERDVAMGCLHTFRDFRRRRSDQSG